MNRLPRLHSFVSLLVLELRRSFRLTYRYPLDCLLALAFLLALFWGLLFGAESLVSSDTRFGQTKDSMLIGYLCWVIVLGGIGHVAHDIQEEAKTGTLESLFCSSYSPLLVFWARSLSGLAVGVPLLVLLALAAGLISGGSASFSSAMLSPILGLEMTATGIGFGLGGIALVFKRVQMLLLFVQIAVMLLVMTRFETMAADAWRSAVPFLSSVESLRQMSIENASLSHLQSAVLIVNGGVYFLVGICVFVACVAYTKRRGVLSHH